jgi:tRNA(Ile)-lysidine synthetase-like protein
LWCRFLNATVWDVAVWRDRHGYDAEPVTDLNSLHTFSHLLESPRKSASEVNPCKVDIKAAIRRSINSVGPRVAVSVSGGVDSMVAATVARDVCKELGKELVLLHISYRNRAECEDECNLLRWWSQQLGVPLYIRRIAEIQRVRQSGLRTVYEEVTRRIRFAFYRWFACPVILGHNLDDCYENVFANLAKQIHLDNLYGMRDVGEEQDVVVLRPFLDIAKADIVTYADSAGIPHLYDSTPAWSRRGQMRDRLIPGIREFDVGILEGLRAVVARTRFLESQWEQAFERWIVGIPQGDCIELPRDEFLESNKGEAQFWVRLYQRIGWPRPSNKSLRNCMEMLNRRVEGVCTVSRDISMQIRKNVLVLCVKK